MGETDSGFSGLPCTGLLSKYLQWPGTSFGFPTWMAEVQVLGPSS